MNGKISGFKYNARTHVAHFSLYVPKSGGKERRERTVEAESRDQAVGLWTAFRDELAGRTKPQPQLPPVVPPQPAPPPTPPRHRS